MNPSHWVFSVTPENWEITRKRARYILKNRSWDTIALSFFGFLVLIGLDFAIKELDMPKLIKDQIAYMAPMMFLSTETIEDDKPLSTELSKLKKEITENLSPLEKAFFRNSLKGFQELGLLKGVKP
jgi:hypothetical protein